MTFTKDDLTAALERCEKATPGPWSYNSQLQEFVMPDGGLYWLTAQTALSEEDSKSGKFARQITANLDFITHARTYYPRALVALEEAWNEVDILQRRWSQFSETYGSAAAFDIALRAAEEKEI